jgi:hypothetical protein
MVATPPTRDAPVASELVAALSRSESHPITVTQVETHISRVLLTDTRVFKLKKPVRFPFLDYSTLELRRGACGEEVRLNRRLAPGIYTGVLPITRDVAGTVEFNGAGTPIDYCVAMQRLPADRMLDGLVRRHAAGAGDISRLLEVLVPFYQGAARNPDIDSHATAEAIEANARQNLAILHTPEHGLPPPMYERVRASQLQYLHFSRDVFQARIDASRVCEGHGDLRPEHVCMLEPPVVFDCVEFSLPLRSADVVSELAFLAMELEFLGAPALAHQLLDEYERRSSDVVPPGLASFYKSYRACIRAKVRLLRSDQQADAAAADSRAHARRYLQLASFYATEFYRPRLFVFCGAAGTGKSSLARAVADALGLEVVRTDTVRHRLVGAREPGAEPGRGIYDAATTARTYEAVFETADRLLRESVSVALDGTFRRAAERDRAVQLAQRHGAELLFVYCHCPPELAQRRIAERLAQHADESDARPDIHGLQQKDLDAADWRGVPMTSADTTRTPAELLTAILDAARRGSR